MDGGGHGVSVRGGERRMAARLALRVARASLAAYREQARQHQTKHGASRRRGVARGISGASSSVAYRGAVKNSKHVTIEHLSFLSE